MTDPARTNTSIVFDNNDGSLMRRLELNFHGVEAAVLDPGSLAVLRRRKFVVVDAGVAKMTPLGSLAFRECDVVDSESRVKCAWVLANARITELGIKLSDG